MEKRISIFGDYVLYRWSIVKKQKGKKYILEHDSITLGGVFIAYANMISAVNKLLPEFDCEYDLHLTTTVPSIVKSNVDEGNNIKYVNTTSYNLENTILDRNSYRELLTLKYDTTEDDRSEYVLSVDSNILDDVTLVVDLGKEAVSKKLIDSVKSKVKVAIAQSKTTSNYSGFDLVIFNKNEFFGISNKKRVSRGCMREICKSYGFNTIIVVGDELDFYVYEYTGDKYYRKNSTSKPTSYKVGIIEAFAGILTVLSSKEDITFEGLKKNIDKTQSIINMLLETQNPLCIL